jgi:hypothetical protein
VYRLSDTSKQACVCILLLNCMLEVLLQSSSSTAQLQTGCNVHHCKHEVQLYCCHSQLLQWCKRARQMLATHGVPLQQTFYALSEFTDVLRAAYTAKVASIVTATRVWEQLLLWLQLQPAHRANSTFCWSASKLTHCSAQRSAA